MQSASIIRSEHARLRTEVAMSIPGKLGDPTQHSRCQALTIVHMMLTRSFQDYYENESHGFWQLLICVCFGVGVSV